MRKPPLFIRLCGHPAMAFIFQGIAVWVFVMSFLGDGNWLATLYGAAVGCWFTACANRVRRYEAHRREWDSYLPPGERPW